MANEEFSKIRLQTPVSLLLHGANKFGFELAKVLVEQGSKVIIVDEYDVESKKYISDLKKLGDVDFVDFKGYEQLFKTINRIDYIFYSQYSYLIEFSEFSSKEFLEESNYLNIALKAAVQFNAKFALLSTISHNKKLALQLSGLNYVTPSPYSSTELQKYAETLTAEYYDKSKANVRILRLGTILGEGLEIQDDDVLEGLIDEAVNSTLLTITGEGLDTHYIINLEDAIYGILKLTFSEKTSGEVISLCNNTEYTTLSIAYKILELNTSAIEIKFVPDKTKRAILYNQYLPATNAEKFGWKQSITFESSIHKLIETQYKRKNKKWNKPEKSTLTDKTKSFMQNVSNVKIERTALGEFFYKLATPFRLVNEGFKKITGTVVKKENLPDIKYLILTTIILGLLFYFILGPIISITFAATSALSEAKATAINIQNLNFAEAKPQLERISKYSNSININLARIKWIFDITGQGELFKNTQDLTTGANLIVDGSVNSVEGLVPLGNYLKEFEPAIDFDTEIASTTREYREELKAIQNQRAKIINSTNDILLGLDYINGIDPEAFPEFTKTNIIELKKYSQDIGELIVPAQNIVSFMPDLLGIDGRKRYLVILQNPSELRSTGGWISSYALIGVEAGQIRELRIDDVYNVEGTLINENKTYSAPDEMQKALGIKNWSASLSNWDPDFANASSSAEFFIKEAGIAPDINGFISINVSFIQDLINAWGGIEVPGEKEVITSDNLYTKIFEMHTEFTPGSTAKSDFLSRLSGAIIKRLLTSEIEDIRAVSSVIFDSLNKKDILVYIEDQKANQYFSNQGWTGSIEKDHLNTPIAVQWNWGGNKANLFLQQQHDLTVNVISTNELKYTYELEIKNNSVTNTYPEGDYANYLRIILPEEALITNLSGFQDNYYNERSINNRKIISGWFNVPASSTNQLKLSYTLRRETNNINTFPISTKANDIILNIDYFKQPGLLNADYKFEVTYPDSWRIKSSNNLNRVSNFVTSEGVFDTDKEYNIVWEMK